MAYINFDKYSLPPQPSPRPLTTAPANIEGGFSTQSLREEGGGGNPLTTAPANIEGGFTSQSLGEEGGVTTNRYETGDLPTRVLGENGEPPTDGGLTKNRFENGYGNSGGPQPTTLSLAEEGGGGTTTTFRLREEGGNSPYYS